VGVLRRLTAVGAVVVSVTTLRLFRRKYIKVAMAVLTVIAAQQNLFLLLLPFILLAAAALSHRAAVLSRSTVRQQAITLFTMLVKP
jgi:hypothetical protein